MPPDLASLKTLSISKLSELHRLTGPQLEKRLLEVGITLQGFRIIGLLLGGEKTNQKRLSEQLGIRPASISAAITKLEKEGNIIREIDPNDKRINYLSISDKVNLADAAKVLFNLESRITKGIKAKDMQTTKRVLDEMIENIKSISEK